MGRRQQSLHAPGGRVRAENRKSLFLKERTAHRRRFGSTARPSIRSGTGQACRAQPACKRRTVKDGGHRRGNGVDIRGVDQPCGIACHFRQRCRRGCNDGNAGRERFQHRQAETGLIGSILETPRQAPFPLQATVSSRTKRRFHLRSARDVPTSALIIKLAAMGDVTMSLSMVTAIQAGDPNARITWMCGQGIAPLVRRVEGISEVIEVDETSILAGTTIAKITAVVGAWQKTFGRRFDTVYVAHSDLRYQVLTWALRAKTVRRLRGGSGERSIVPGRTHADEYVRLVTGRDDWRARSFSAPTVRIGLTEALANRIEQFNPDGRPLVALTPGGARNVARESPLRRWPLERYAALARALHESGYCVVLTGLRTDGWASSAFCHHPVLDLIGATDVPSLASVLQRCAVVVAHDSGTLHLARLVGTPVVALLGPTPPTMFFRHDPHTIVLWPGGSLPCAPCYDGNEFAKCDNNVCMQMIEVESILRHLHRKFDVAIDAAPHLRPAFPIS